MFAGLSVFSSTTSPLSIGLVHYTAMLMPYLDVPVSQMAADTETSWKIAWLLQLVTAQVITIHNHKYLELKLYPIFRSGARANCRMHSVKMETLAQLSDGLKEEVNDCHGQM